MKIAFFTSLYYFWDVNYLDTMKMFFRTLAVSVLIFCALACGNKKKIVSIEGGNVKVVARSSEGKAAKVRAILERGRLAVDSIRKPVIGSAAHALDKYIPESPLMNFAADALLTTAREHTGQRVDIAITNKGGLRSNIAEGEITFGDVYNVFPFENTLALLTLNGEQLLQLCAEIASVGGEAISGLELVITKDGELLSASVAGKPVDKAGSYRIATSDYLAQGNDKMTALALGTEREIRNEITIRDLMLQYIKSLAKAGKAVSAECDGRIIVKE